VSHRAAVCRRCLFGGGGFCGPRSIRIGIVRDLVETRPSPVYHIEFVRSRSDYTGVDRFNSKVHNAHARHHVGGG